MSNASKDSRDARPRQGASRGKVAKSKSSREIYFPHSPYTVFLALGMALDRRHPDRVQDLVVYQQYPETSHLVKWLTSQPSFPFDRVLQLDRRLEGKSALGKLILIRRNMLAVRSFVDASPPSQLWIFNDSFPSEQYAAYLAGRLTSPATRTFVDEGASSYSSVLYPQPGSFLSLVRRAAIGRWWRELRKLGGSGYNDRALLFFPELAHEELSSLPKYPLDSRPYRTAELRELAMSFLASISDGRRWAPLDLLLFPAHSETTRPFRQEYVAALSSILTTACRRGLRSALKFHPRERDADYIESIAAGEESILPQAVPAEFILLAAARELSFVIGDFSTAMLTARWLSPATNSFVLSDFVEQGDTRLAEVLPRAGLQTIQIALQGADRIFEGRG